MFQEPGKVTRNLEKLLGYNDILTHLYFILWNSNKVNFQNFTNFRPGKKAKRQYQLSLQAEKQMNCGS